MHHSNDVDTVLHRKEEDDIAPKRQTAQTGSQLLALAPHQGLCCPKAKATIQLVDPAIGLLNTVRRDVLPDVQDVGLGLLTTRDTSQLCRSLR